MKTARTTSHIDDLKRQYRRSIGSIAVAKTIDKMGGGHWMKILGNIESKDPPTLRLVSKVKAYMADQRYG